MEKQPEAKRMGISATAVRNHARNLERRKQYLTRHKRLGQPNLFDLRPLFAALEKVQAAKEQEQKELSRKQAF
jgi:predicted ArsR family transcriptional regulator